MALGTLFYYARDKRDLIYLIFNEEFDFATTQGLEACSQMTGFKAKILAITEPFYRFFAREPELSRILLSEVQQHSPGFHLARNLEIRERLIAAMEALVAEAQHTGEIRYAEEPRILAMSTFYCFSSAVRWWIATPNPKWRVGHKSFERFFNVIAHGLMHSNAADEGGRKKVKGKARKNSIH
jgi:AcrR family transcriptional regulator